MNWTAAQIAEACAGEIRGDENARASAISTDTRALNPGDAFLALRGENFDGHDYLDRAVEAGASILIVDTPGKAPENVTSVIVKDTLRAWGELAAFYRDRFSARRIGIVGSSGKTTVKDMLAAILRDAAGEDAVLATEANYNNLVGVPKNIFRLNANHQYAVLEMGMNVPGELARLARIADPELLVFLNVGTAHIGMFDSLDGLLAAKAEAVENLSESARVLYDADSEHTCTIMRDKAKTAPENRKTFALDNPADYRAINIQAFHDSEARQEWGYQFEIDFQGEKHKARLPMFGRHNVRNALAAAAAVHLMGIDAAAATEALAKLCPSPMRSEVRAAGDSCLIVD
ncbi:MAG: UDP-N-acetylmuramoyl-tripeptide--D-alanyl-D-alanine ligase, partial [Candidatus Sumerlaeota bacterium]